jgi:glycosyltransferase involved in cell wall biosynthesis
MNILFLSSWYPNRVKPTLGNFVQKHAEAAALYDNVSALYVCSDAACKTAYELEEATINGVYTVNVYYKKVGHTIPLLSQFQKARRYLRAHSIGLERIREKMPQIDLVHHNILYPAGIVALRLKKKYNIPYIITENWTGYLPSKNIKLDALQKHLSKKIAANAACITPVSLDLKNAMLAHGFLGRYEIIYNVMDTRLFFPAKERRKDGKIRFLHISSLDDAHKNISGMLRVAKQLSLIHPELEFRFVGDGDTSPHIRYAKELGIYNTSAFFEGTKTTAEVAQLMREADCFLMFSNYENLPCVIIEALASGLPVVSSTAGGIPEHISEDKGLLVAPRDETALFSAIEQVLKNIRSEKYRAEELSAYAKEHFSYEHVGAKFHGLYERMRRH